MNGALRAALRVGALVAATLCVAGAGSISPPRGSPAPAIALDDLDGHRVSTAALAPRTLVLIFGELNQETTKQACADTLDALSTPELAAEPVTPVLVIAQDAPISALKEAASRGRFPAIILHDSKRDAFAAYHVIALPTVIVVDGNAKVVHSFPGFLQRPTQSLIEATRTALGKMSFEEFDRLQDPARRQPSEESVRADRLAHLGDELARHALLDLAQARYTEAVKLVPGHLAATLGLAETLLRQDRLDESAATFGSVIAAHPESQDAAVGLAAVQIRRGGDELSRAEQALKLILEKNPKHARARYLMGRVMETRSDVGAAMAEYRRAAEILLER